jgi:hypothetical protein
MSRSRIRRVVVALAASAVLAVGIVPNAFAAHHIGMRVVPTPTTAQPANFTVSMSTRFNLTGSEFSVSCEQATAVGAFTSAESGHIEFTLSKCRLSKLEWSCNTPGAGSGVILTGSRPIYATSLWYDGPRRLVANPDQESGERPTIFVPNLTCGTVSLGSVIGEPEFAVGPLNTKGKSFSFEAIAEQEYMNEKDNGVPASLKWTTPKGVEESITLGASGSLVFSKEYEFQKYS